MHLPAGDPRRAQPQGCSRTAVFDRRMPRQETRRHRDCSGKQELGRCIAHVGTGLRATGRLNLCPSMPRVRSREYHGQQRCYNFQLVGEKDTRRSMATTDSATGTLVAWHDEGSKVVGAVSSEMAIPYSAKTLHERTMVPRAAADTLKRGWQDGSIVSLSKWTGPMDQTRSWVYHRCSLRHI